MDSEMVKSKPLTKDETKALLELIETSQIIISKATNASNNKLKVEEWARITAQFNATASTCPRTPQQLRLKWENLKKNSRKRSTKIRMNSIQTGGGASEYIPPDEILDRVASLLGSTGIGFSVPFGGDRETAVVFVGGDAIGGGDSVNSGDKENVLDIEELYDEPVCEAKNIVLADVDVATVTSMATPKPFTLNSFTHTPRTADKRKITRDKARDARNLAIAEYYNSKKKCMDLQYTYLQLQNEKLRLEIENEKRKC